MMAMRVRLDERGGWQVALDQASLSLVHGPFPDAVTARDWGARAALALKQCTIRIGSKRFLGNAAEALQRWAIDQGTLPRAEGGTQIAPVRRLATLAADPLCQWPIALLLPEQLACLRRARQAALAHPALMLGEQAALAAALEQFRDFHLPALPNPFLEAAPDGVGLLDGAACQQVQLQAEAMGGPWPRLIGLLLSSGASRDEICSARCGQADRAAERLHLPDGRWVSAPASWLPAPREEADAPLLPGLAEHGDLAAGFEAIGERLNRRCLRPEALQLTALAAALARGSHLDEVLHMAGAVAIPCN